MSKPRLSPFPAACLLLCACVLLAVGAGVARAADPQAGARQSQLCLECHSGMDSTLVGSPHQLPATEGASARVACTDCHGSDRRHWEDDAAANPLTDPSKLRADAEARLCATCHQSAHQQEMRQRNEHLVAGVACSACHAIHHPAHEPLLKVAENSLCTSCHRQIAGEFARPYGHPVNDRAMTCSDCHVMHGANVQRLGRTPNDVCTRCHPAMQGPFPHEHPATLGFGTDEGGCVSCHEPHGSGLPRMLKQPYEGTRAPLCTQCHAVPRHLNNTMHGTRWADVPCSECHTDIHGSYVSRLLLSESLRSRGCFNAGCHHGF